LIRMHQEPLDVAQIWLSWNQVPLKWFTAFTRHYPIGLLYDLNEINETWHLQIHCENYPIQLIPKWEHSRTGYEYYMSMLKEADQIRNQSIKFVMGLSTADQSKLWESIENSIYTFIRQFSRF
jgi:hypothetical protein